MNFSTILTGIGSAASGGILGGILGLLGIGVKAWQELKELKELNRHKEEMIRLTTQSMKMEAEMRIKIKDKEIEGLMAQADADIQKQTYKSDQEETKALTQDFSIYGKKKGYFLALMQELMLIYKSSVRPTLAYTMTAFIIYMFIKLYFLIGGLSAIPQDKLIQMFMNLINVGSTGFTMALTWYFYIRPKRR